MGFEGKVLNRAIWPGYCNGGGRRLAVPFMIP